MWSSRHNRREIQEEIVRLEETILVQKWKTCPYYVHSFKPPNLLYVAFCDSKETENQIRKNSKGIFVGRYGGKKEDPLGKLVDYL